MTNGSVINLGGYGKGFGNGMSGGVSYQYDINGKLILFTNEKVKNISNLNKGIYILKSENKTQKISVK